MLAFLLHLLSTYQIKIKIKNKYALVVLNCKLNCAKFNNNKKLNYYKHFLKNIHHLIGLIVYFNQLNPNTLVSSSPSSSSGSYNVIVIWSKSKSSSLKYEPLQRMTREVTGRGINRLVLMNQKKEEEEEFASCSYWEDDSIIIWRREKGGKGEFQINRK